MVSIFGLQVQAACTYYDEFKDNKNGTVTDQRSGLVWKRCAEGFSWNGKVCTGKRLELTWYDAMQKARDSDFLGHKDWRIPTYQEFKSVVGRYENCDSNAIRVNGAFTFKYTAYAASKSIAHAVASGNFPGYFHNSTPTGKLTTVGVGFAVGMSAETDPNDSSRISTNLRTNWRDVRLVRSSDATTNQEFLNEFKKMDQYKAADEVYEKQKR